MVARIVFICFGLSLAKVALKKEASPFLAYLKNTRVLFEY